jgi:hypothetical protein
MKLGGQEQHKRREGEPEDQTQGKSGGRGDWDVLQSFQKLREIDRETRPVRHEKESEKKEERGGRGRSLTIGGMSKPIRELTRAAPALTKDTVSDLKLIDGWGGFIPFATEWNQRERKLLQDGRCPGPSFSPTWTPQ